MLLGVLSLAAFVLSPGGQATALGFKKDLKKRKIPLEEYSVLPDGLKYYELATGNGGSVDEGSRVVVHFDCLYKGIDAVSSRQSRLLGGNRTISEPFEFIAGGKIDAPSVKKAADTAGGLFSGAGGPRPPAALSRAVIGMKPGGKRSVIVPPELGYGNEGNQEIPAGATIELRIEVLSVQAA